MAAHARRTICILGSRCRELRQQCGLTREAVAELSSGNNKLSVATIKRAESGHPIYPSSAAALARILGVSIADLLTEPVRLPTREKSQGATIRPAKVAVLPFEVIASDSRGRNIARACAAETVHRLAETVPLVAGAAGNGPQPAALSHAELGAQLGAEYLVEGHVCVHNSDIRFIVNLIRASDACYVWSKGYETSGATSASLASIARDLALEIGWVHLAREGSRLTLVEPTELDTAALALRGIWHFYRTTAADSTAARDCARRAIEHEPFSATARYLLVLSYHQDLLQGRTDVGQAYTHMLEEIAEFKRTIPANALMHLTSAYGCMARGDNSEALKAVEYSLELAPDSPRARLLYGQLLSLAGHSVLGLQELEQARALRPTHPAMWTLSLPSSIAHFAAANYEESITWAQRAVLDRPQVLLNRVLLAAAWVRRGDLASAARTVSELQPHRGPAVRQAIEVAIGGSAAVCNEIMDAYREAQNARGGLAFASSKPRDRANY
jgi:TolB-like protein